ncbi:HsmA family protein [Bacillus mycoides]|uniref:TIGR03987 family protein n=1 Tax=Bacillus thuringiensis serovar navarrensis TaxID=339658 RepID=A0A243AHD8_BACTU|nr:MULTISPECIES: HsmA family protein [Bacillus cereus group]MED1270319.1 HsmA family protein [Bacillus mycoides]OTY19721.1 TIGR03987 family protein [Bacillus thuringiensis serovar navarrensis]
MLASAITFITAALIFYSVGVWSEKIQKTLKPWHVYIFWIGLACDTIGTTLMERMASEGSLFSFHGITGLSAILLMLFHAVWATLVLKKKDIKMIAKFHTLSVIVWFIWFIPYISGLVYGMKNNS